MSKRYGSSGGSKTSKAKHRSSEKRETWSRQRREIRRNLGQNFLKDERKARQIVSEAGISDTDLVVEFGAGSGMLTRALSEKAGRVMAVEYDPSWVDRLGRSFPAAGSVEIISADALTMSLPQEPFKVVANVPFHITTEILRRLLDDPDGLLRTAHLLVQKDVARKHARPSPTTLTTLRWSPWWRFEAPFELPAAAFDPKPTVDACLLVAAKRDPPLVASEHGESFRALVGHAFGANGNVVGKALRPIFTKRQIRRLARDNGFSADSFPSRLTVHQWASVFEFMVRGVPKNRWPGSAAR